MQIDGSLNAEFLSDIPRRTRELIDIGYDGFYMFEGREDVFLPCTLAANETRGSHHLSTQVAVAFARNPLSLAYIANDLNALAGGKFVLGLGTQARQNIEQRFSMPWGKPVSRMRDMVRAIQAIFRCWDTGEPLRHEGEYYRHTKMQPMFTPPMNPHGRPKIMLGGIGAPMTRLAGEVADAFVIIPFHAPRFLEQVTFPALDEGAALSGRTRADLDLYAQCMVVTGLSEERYREAYERTRHQIAFYGSTPIYAKALQAEGWGEYHARWRQMAREGQWQEMAATVPDQMVEAFAVTGTPREVATKLHARFGDFLSRLSVMTTYVMEAEAEAQLVAELQRLRAA